MRCLSIGPLLVLLLSLLFSISSAQQELVGQDLSDQGKDGVLTLEWDEVRYILTLVLSNTDIGQALVVESRKILSRLESEPDPLFQPKLPFQTEETSWFSWRPITSSFLNKCYSYVVNKAIVFPWNSNSTTERSLSRAPDSVLGQLYKQDGPALSKELSIALEKLSLAANKYSNRQAKTMLADMMLFGNYSTPVNVSQSLEYYKEVAVQDGDPRAQFMVGFLYATGMCGQIDKNQAKALLYYTAAATADNIQAEMVLGYKYQAGVDVFKDCEKSVGYYKKVATKALEFWKSGPPLGRRLDSHATRLADINGGVYGEGASFMVFGSKIHSQDKIQYSSTEDIVEYLRYQAQKGHENEQYDLATIYYQGTAAISRNYELALYYFKKASAHFWGPRDSKPIAAMLSKRKDMAINVAAMLGRMYLRGEGTEPDYPQAYEWFRRGASLDGTYCIGSLGYMKLHGLGTEQNTEEAIKLLKIAASKGLSMANTAVGKILWENGDFQGARAYLEDASKYDIEGAYYLAKLYESGLGGVQPSCKRAVELYRYVAERCEVLHSPFKWAQDMYNKGDYYSSLVGYLITAELGNEAGQANAAYLLDDSDNFLARHLMTSPRNSRLDEMALTYWKRSSNQQNVDSTLKMGDYYLMGTGCRPDPAKAAACYQAAAYERSAMAHWNLGWMHENGIGVEQDFHLAKRFYDLALEVSSGKESYLPVTLSLIKLRWRVYWNAIMGRNVKGISDFYERAADQANRKKISFQNLYNKLREYALNNIMEQELEERQQQQQQQQQHHHHPDDTNDPLRRGRNGGDGSGDSPDGDDHILYRGGDIPDEEVYDIEYVENFLNIFVPLGTLLFICFLIYHRQRRDNNNDDNNNNNDDNDNNGGERQRQQQQQAPPPPPLQPLRPLGSGPSRGVSFVQRELIQSNNNTNNNNNNENAEGFVRRRTDNYDT